ncbi:hypothetical protein [Streptomyces sp. MNU77]|uniref:hypothetical protein n=1 Tax=Streptomyces sp. MNU77 TaxID=1573406 RepID=UPI0015C1269A|nr:hypothetical protein [Streptomyces sp. MNU77]
MTTGIEARHYTGDQAPALRPLLLDVYTEIYADAASPSRFAEGLDHWTARPGWSCVIGYDNDQPVGYAYRAPLPPGSRWWGGLLTQVPADVTAETGTRTYALSELMVRTPWRKTGTARRPVRIACAGFCGKLASPLLHVRQLGVTIPEDCRDALCLQVEIRDLLGRLADEFLGHGGVQPCPVGPVGQLEQTAVDLGLQPLQAGRRRSPVVGRRTQLAQVGFNEVRVRERTRAAPSL